MPIILSAISPEVQGALHKRHCLFQGINKGSMPAVMLRTDRTYYGLLEKMFDSLEFDDKNFSPNFYAELYLKMQIGSVFFTNRYF